jgi:hypothetical protein
MDLTQGNMTVTQYVGCFNELACFATYMVADEENRVKKFEQGLNPWIHDRVVCFEIRDFVELIYKASLAKESVKRNVIRGMLWQWQIHESGLHPHRIETKSVGNKD